MSGKDEFIVPMTIEKIEHVQQRLLWKLFKGLPDGTRKFMDDNGIYIAGGAITSIFSGTKINDHDIYFLEDSGIEKAIAYFIGKGYRQTMKTDNAITYKRKTNNGNRVVQLITNPSFIGMPRNVFKHFDFVHCMGAYLNGKIHMHDMFLECIAERRMVFNPGTAYPIASLIRSKKYMNRGYSISGLEIIKMALTIHALEIKNVGDLKKQLMGIDVQLLLPLWDIMEDDEVIRPGGVLEKLEGIIAEYYENNHRGGDESSLEDDDDEEVPF